MAIIKSTGNVLRAVMLRVIVYYMVKYYKIVENVIILPIPSRRRLPYRLAPILNSSRRGY